MRGIAFLQLAVVRSFFCTCRYSRGRGTRVVRQGSLLVHELGVTKRGMRKRTIKPRWALKVNCDGAEHSKVTADLLICGFQVGHRVGPLSSSHFLSPTTLTDSLRFSNPCTILFDEYHPPPLSSTVDHVLWYVLRGFPICFQV